MATPTKVLIVAFSKWFQSHSANDVSYASAQREWRELQAAIQVARGRSPLLLAVAPVNSPQYRLARRILKKRRARGVEAVLSNASVQIVESSEVWESHCAVLDVDVHSAHELNEQIATTSHEWLFPAASNDSRDDVARVIAHLLAHAQSDTTIYFAGDHELATPRGVGPHTLLSYNVIGRGAIFPRAAVMAVGGFHEDANDIEHDLVLRLCEAGYDFVGLPAEHSLANSRPADPSTTATALRRRGITGSVSPSNGATSWSVMRRPTVDIVVPTRDRLELLQPCIAAIEANCGDFAVTITIVDNGSRDSAIVEYFAASPHRVVAHPGPFNYAAVVNHGVAAGRNDVVVVLNNDTIVGPGWLESLVPLATLHDVGVVGATLVSPSGEVQHAGMGAVPYPVELPYGRIPQLTSSDVVVLSARQAESIRNVIAVTGACHVVERAKWNLVDGMDESLHVTANDVDLCLRLSQRGYYTVLHPAVRIEHVGKASRGTTESEDDHVRFLQRWGYLRDLVDPCVPYRRATLVSADDLMSQ